MSQIDTRGKVPIFKLPLPSGCGAEAVVFFRVTALNSDVDGSKTAYGPHNEGTDYTANAGEPNHWWALVCRDGQPIVVDGYYVSTTSLQDPAYPAEDRRRYVDAQSIPFFVLPVSRYREWGIKLGDLAWVVKLDKQGRAVANGAAIFADAGPEVGEGSAQLIRELGGDPDPRRGGIDGSTIQFFIFAGSGDGLPHPAGEIADKVGALLPALAAVDGGFVPRAEPVG